ncbi:MAG TPA: tRNA lysidine(34) synthetase TilS [Candidatus Saccharimonadales bacterium]|nr:tRNA lysidine(34) synthetase TilS [Candidatus Saccharimonadales bacterium]
MEAQLESGRYVVAVSGGIDSIVLLHLLRGRPDLQLTVAHYDHGIRPDSRQDRLLVQELARDYGLPFVYDAGRLGAGASEAAARQARYAFLHKARQATLADAVVTAHHKDDVLETAILNLIRGGSRKGMAALRDTALVRRPLLNVRKIDIRDYAARYELRWHEDSTNKDTKYLRNHVRHALVPRIDNRSLDELYARISRLQILNQEIDRLLAGLMAEYVVNHTLDLRAFRQLPHAIAREVMATWLRTEGITILDKKMLERLAHGAKIHKEGRIVEVNKTTVLKVYDRYLALEPRER